MNKYLTCLVLLLSGCYLANGSPSDIKFWMKDGQIISVREIWNCEQKAYASLGERSLFLYNKFRNKESLSNEEYKELSKYIPKATLIVRQCYYDLGYRFKAPLSWCLAQDGDNTKVCIENMKYRN
ncbi:hypothetical protein [Bibersteinia trehalosi]|uniref:hypothetical protein n=1 Tax=Bibersteinia trehalosi TaxID=47735 RepID=UPI00046D2663|nr:hypothetical protein [Bibersteinia trehalosi]